MGQRGPKPKRRTLTLIPAPPATRRPSRRVRKGVPDRPPELTGEAAAEWDRLAVELDAAGWLAVTDRGILAAYCMAVADLLAARAEIVQHGRWYDETQQSSKGVTIGTRPREHPAVKLASDASRRIEKLGSALGITPAGRSRLEGDGPAEAVGNRVLDIRDRIQAARNRG